MKNDRICVGVLAGAFGVHGEVRLKSYCAEPTDIADYGPLWSKDGSKSYQVTLTRPIKNGFAARVSGISNKEDADAALGVELFADRDALPSLPDDEFYHADLIGMIVQDTGGQELGRVKAVHNHGAGDVLEVLGPGMRTGALLPFTRAAVPTVDLASGRIVADPPEGVFPESENDASEPS
ncbi:ribosome maturation factor RimM [Aliiroseovarius sp. KMU-50]|uniref:Ribosome maturation factor RimM n=1 Tax=Aliiroseovarius salicola TaxID=3009082 RepID=A0ABT4VZB5_9RHOB|nr:ribosome maturation factor RimM [Aliiroseovarius sp. KMU-50]MDA5093594.1 ribosome maturation factor RimM [Aliiroseovarius sp. KMU-50]